MPKEHQHQWACLQSKGNLGEITTKTPLTSVQVELVTKDLSQAEIVCPGGVLTCLDCNTSMFGEQTGTAIDFTNLNTRLFQPKKISSEE